MAKDSNGIELNTGDSVSVIKKILRLKVQVQL